VTRLASGGRIDRAALLGFTFDGRPVRAFRGDTVASALLAGGTHLMGRSFKYHRPRGVLSHGVDEPNALVSVDRGPGRVDPNNRATVVEVTDGLAVASQNAWPSLRRDAGAVNDLLHPLFPAGFYYKTFLWPRAFWDHVYEPVIRRAAGLGVAPRAPDPDRYVHRHAHAEVLVAGAGPAGIAAALAASETAVRVILADEQMEMGGTLLHDTAEIDGRPAAAWLAAALAELARRPNVTLLPRTTVFGYYNHNHVALVERVTDHMARPDPRLPRERLWQVRAREVVLATGSHERPLTFAGNDRPGVMLAESVRAYVNRWAAAPGRRIVFVTNGASAYRAAADVAAAGLEATIVDTRPAGAIGVERELAPNAEILAGHTVVGTAGRLRVSRIDVAPVDGGRAGARRTLACDAVGMSGGWTPAVHLFSQSRGKLAFRAEIDAFVPGTSVQRERSAGACRGTYDLTAVIAEGLAAGDAAARAAGRPTTRTRDPAGAPGAEDVGHLVATEAPARPAHAATPTATGFVPVRILPTDRDPRRVRAFVDFQNDVTAKDLKLAVREGFVSVEHVKRYTTNGMATDQGKTSNMTGLGILAETLGKAPPAVGTTTFRPPYTPVTFGAIAGSARGRTFEPLRRTPIDAWAAEHGAAFENVGLWRRAWYFPRPDEDMAAAVRRECRAVRSSVGIFDASTLGKIEVVGPDAAEFLNRIYTNAWTKLAPGRCRYGLMLKEDGFVFDDGVVARLGEDRFHVTTTTGGAPRVLAHMEDYLQTEWPDLEVFVTSTTEQWAVVALQGPLARDVLAPLTAIDLSPAAFPHMAIRLGDVAGVPARLFRVSFTGELGFEINVPAGAGHAVWEAVFAAGERHGITPYGTEAMHVLRAERGFIVVGQETDGTVTPDDLGLSAMVSKQKPDFVGKRSLVRPDMTKPDRKQLVGLRPLDGRTVLDEGAQIVEDPAASLPMPMLGHVTSSYWSDAAEGPIALALVAGGRARTGATIWVTTPSGFIEARITVPVFFDPEGSRVDGVAAAAPVAA
jgi:sarcosine oxidase subunit alpha